MVFKMYHGKVQTYSCTSKKYNKFGVSKYIKSVQQFLSYDVAAGSEIRPCNKIDKPLVVYRYSGNVMTSTTKLRS